MRVLVDRIIYRVGETIARGQGRVVGGPHKGKEVEFAGDWRPMLDIKGAITAGEEPEAEIEDWQVLRMGEL